MPSTSRPGEQDLLRRLYDWTMTEAAGPHATRGLAAVAFLESSVFPIPPDAMLVPMVLARPGSAWRLAAICTAASVAGGLAGYAIGYFLFATLGSRIIEFYGLGGKFADFQQTWNDWGLWIILVKGLTPIPYKLVTIASGLAKFNLAVFVLASIVTRAARFFLVAGLLRVFGTPIRTFIEERLTLVTTAFAVLIVLGFAVLHYL